MPIILLSGCKQINIQKEYHFIQENPDYVFVDIPKIDKNHSLVLYDDSYPKGSKRDLSKHTVQIEDDFDCHYFDDDNWDCIEKGDWDKYARSAATMHNGIFKLHYNYEDRNYLPKNIKTTISIFGYKF